ncbi:MAG: iron ABC transporter permease [Phycisphaerales bacterium]|jgi:iron complex transport system permease protein
MLGVALLTLLLAGAVIVRLAIGRDQHGLIFRFEFLDERVLRVLAGGTVGVALAAAGVFLQSLLRNPLASPDILGLSAGSGLGVMVAAYLAFLAGHGISGAESLGISNAIASTIGALVAITIVYLLAQRRGVLEPTSLVLVGVVVAMMCGAGTMLVRQLLPDQGLASGRLLLGAVRDVTPRELYIVTPICLATALVGASWARAMDAASLSDDETRTLGVPLGLLRAVLFIAAAVLTAGSVLLAGPVGFVGLIAPHMGRLLIGPRHGPLILASCLCGAIVVIFCDAMVRAIDLGSGQFPIGVLTALAGGPVLISLLRRRRADLT